MPWMTFRHPQVRRDRGSDDGVTATDPDLRQPDDRVGEECPASALRRARRRTFGPGPRTRPTR